MGQRTEGITATEDALGLRMKNFRTTTSRPHWDRKQRLSWVVNCNGASVIRKTGDNPNFKPQNEKIEKLNIDNGIECS